ncbi:MAG: hypothetical protein LBC56_08005 [Oscillospiraceae bacterium]|nr:hypothetical protein [Oscillospiraceae bacterium]
MSLTQMTIKRMLLVLMKRWWWMALGFMLGASAMGFVTQYILPVEYTSKIQVYVSATPVMPPGSSSKPGTSSGGSESVASAIQASELVASQTLAKSCSILLTKNEKILEEALALLNKLKADTYGDPEAKYLDSVDDLRSSFSASPVNDSEVIEIISTTEDPYMSADICDTMAASVIKIMNGVIEGGTAKTIGKSKIAQEPSSPDIKKNLVLGAGAGFAGGLALAVLFAMLDSKIRNEDDLRQRFDVNVLAVVPLGK